MDAYVYLYNAIKENWPDADWMCYAYWLAKVKNADADAAWSRILAKNRVVGSDAQALLAWLFAEYALTMPGRRAFLEKVGDVAVDFTPGLVDFREFASQNVRESTAGRHAHETYADHMKRNFAKLKMTPTSSSFRKLVNLYETLSTIQDPLELKGFCLRAWALDKDGVWVAAETLSLFAKQKIPVGTLLSLHGEKLHSHAGPEQVRLLQKAFDSQQQPSTNDEASYRQDLIEMNNRIRSATPLPSVGSLVAILVPSTAIGLVLGVGTYLITR